MAELMREIASLPKGEQDKLAAFLMHLRLEQDPAWRKQMTRRIDDDSPANWVSLQTWKRELKARK